MIVQVFLARPGAGAFERKFVPESQFDLAGHIEVDEDPDAEDRLQGVLQVAETVFGICNSYLSLGLWEDEMHVDERYRDQVAAYRAGGNRSLSAGDVIAIGEGFYFCASSGWEPITECSHNLMAAFITGNPIKEPSS